MYSYYLKENVMNRSGFDIVAMSCIVLFQLNFSFVVAHSSYGSLLRDGVIDATKYAELEDQLAEQSLTNRMALKFLGDEFAPSRSLSPKHQPIGLSNK
jgi:hypothetical protein